MSSGKSEPSPTRTSEPTIARTIWCRNAFARNRSTIRSPSREMVRRSRRRTVALPSPGCRQNDVKSCSPTRCRAALRIAVKSRSADRCHSYRPRNGSDTRPVSITYRYARALAENRAWNPSGATDAATTTTSGAKCPFKNACTCSGLRREEVDEATPPAPSHAPPHPSAPQPPAAHPPPRCAATTPATPPPPSAQKHPAAKPTPEKQSRHTQDRAEWCARWSRAAGYPKQKSRTGEVREPAQAPKAPSSSRTSPVRLRCW